MDGCRAFVIGENGHVCDAQVFEVISDVAAVEAARQLLNRHDIDMATGSQGRDP